MTASPTDGIGDSLQHAEAALNHLFKRVSETGEAESARRIWDACEALSKAKVKKLTARAVGDYCVSKYSGPKPQSIANRQDTLAALVRSADRVHQLKTGRAQKSAVGARAKVAIEDPAIAAYVAILEEESKELRAHNGRLSKAFRELQPLQIGHEPGVETETRTEFPLTAVQREAIRHFLERDFLAKFDLKYDERGRIADGHRVLVERPVVDVLLTLIGEESDPGAAS